MEIESLYEYLKEKKCKDVAVYELKNEAQSFDYIVLATVSNALNNKRLALTIMQEIGLEKQPEGFNKGEWIVFDFGQLVVHLLVPQARERYNIDKLWQTKKMKFNV